MNYHFDIRRALISWLLGGVTVFKGRRYNVGTCAWVLCCCEFSSDCCFCSSPPCSNFCLKSLVTQLRVVTIMYIWVSCFTSGPIGNRSRCQSKPSRKSTLPSKNHRNSYFHLSHCKINSIKTNARLPVPTPPPPHPANSQVPHFWGTNALRLARFSKTAHLEALILAYLEPHVYLTSFYHSYTKGRTSKEIIRHCSYWHFQVLLYSKGTRK